MLNLSSKKPMHGIPIHLRLGRGDLMAAENAQIWAWSGLREEMGAVAYIHPVPYLRFPTKVTERKEEDEGQGGGA